MHRPLPYSRMIWPRMSVVLQLRVPAVNGDTIIAPFYKSTNIKLLGLKIHGQTQTAICGAVRLWKQEPGCRVSFITYNHRVFGKYMREETQIAVLTSNVGTSKSLLVWKMRNMFEDECQVRRAHMGDLGLIRNLKCVVSLRLSQYPIVNTCWPCPPKLSLRF